MGVAFLDVGVYVTSLRAVKNLLLIGDAVKSIWFLAFQVSPVVDNSGRVLHLVNRKTRTNLSSLGRIHIMSV